MEIEIVRIQNLLMKINQNYIGKTLKFMDLFVEEILEEILTQKHGFWVSIFKINCSTNKNTLLWSYFLQKWLNFS